MSFARLFKGEDPHSTGVSTARQKWADTWSPAANLQEAQGEFQPLRHSQFGHHPVGGPQPEPAVASEQSTGGGVDDWRVPARHAQPHKRWPSNASRSVRGALAPAPAPWSAPITDLAGRLPPQNPPQPRQTAVASSHDDGSELRKSKGKRQPKENPKEAESQDKSGKPGKEQVAATLSTAGPAAGTVVKMGRREGWARFLAYEGCWQICLKATPQEPTQAVPFLKDGCALLRSAFAFDSLLLRPVPKNAPVHGPTLVWDDAEAHQLPTVGYVPQTAVTTMLKCRVVRLSAGTFQGQFASHSTEEQLFVRLRAAGWQGRDSAYTPIDALGNSVNGAEMEVGVEDMGEELLVEICNQNHEVIAMNTLHLSDMWEIANTQARTEITSTPRHKKGLLSFLPCKAAAHKALVETLPGQRWLQLNDRLGTRSAHVLLSAWVEDTTQTVMAATEVPDDYEPQTSDGLGITSKGYQQITPWQVYDITLMAALRTQKCGPQKLTVEGEWKWLLSMFAGTYGICQSYTHLAHLRWVMKPENATVRAACLELLATVLGPLKQMEAAGSLLPQEVAIMAQIAMDCERLLARCFENYYSLSETAVSGILEGGQATTVIPAPALKPAVQLCSILREVLEPLDQVWLAERFSTAAVKRYHRLAGAADDQHPFAGDGEEMAAAHSRSGPLSATAPRQKQMAVAEADAEVAYARVGALCEAIKSELNNDLKIHNHGILPQWINLPQVTAGEYCREFLTRLTTVLRQYPPPHPKKPAVDLLVAVGDQQQYLDMNGLLPPPGTDGALDALQVFGPYVTEWISGSQHILCQRCRQIEASTFATPTADMKEAGKNHIAPLVEEMLDRLTREVDKYERVVQYWPVFGPQLEGAACAALRDTTAAVSRQCGLTQVTREEARRQPGSYLRGPATYESGSPARWRWNQTTQISAEARLHVLSHEAVLMNSLRRMLAEVPQLESKLGHWVGEKMPASLKANKLDTSQSHQASSPGHGGREIAGLGIEYTPDGHLGPQLGAQFAQLVKELRSEYAGAITGCAQRIAMAVFSLGPRVLTLLQQHGLTGNPAQTAQEIEPVLEAMEDVMGRLGRALEGRVFVAVCRGLWDFTAKEVFDYVEGLQEGKENKGAWRGRQNAASALDVVDNFFSAVLSTSLQHELQSKDLDLPLHSDRAHKLLADNTEAMNTSYTVY